MPAYGFRITARPDGYRPTIPHKWQMKYANEELSNVWMEIIMILDRTGVLCLSTRSRTPTEATENGARPFPAFVLPSTESWSHGSVIVTVLGRGGNEILSGVGTARGTGPLAASVRATWRGRGVLYIVINVVGKTPNKITSLLSVYLYLPNEMEQGGVVQIDFCWDNFCWNLWFTQQHRILWLVFFLR